MTSNKQLNFLKSPFFIPWILALLFYALEYGVRSSPSVMIPQLTGNFNLGTTEVSAIISAYYITYSVGSLAAGLLLDRIGAKHPLAIGIIFLALGCVLFISSNYFLGYTGRLLQGLGSAIAFPASVFLAVKAFSGKNLATAIGVTQTLGMLGGSAGQKLSNSYLTSGNSYNSLWIIFGVSSLVLGVLAFVFTPKTNTDEFTEVRKQPLLANYKIVFSNWQSWLCGFASGLLFAPTTIFAMIWGVDFLEQARHLSHGQATVACALVPIGWAIGCPLFGWLADKFEKRIPVLAGGAVVMILCLLQLAFLPHLMGPGMSLFFMGVGSGAAMLPYSTIKEVNPDKVKGSATGAINFLVFGVTSLLSPVFTHLFASKLDMAVNKNAIFQQSCFFFIIAIGIAIFLCTFLRETGKEK
ncbi:Sugar phosphate permease [Epilithonimonas bovis DSM 19482]|uniref:Lysosomal dipeptide transporter MFSD1 n=1 Tax=Epilithonimonas bovis DSM 19482 TaxID=1121284 RepID=A0A1U7Q096_9FLAO|nr:MFS transporter [Epilithonimonas bovis]SIT97700.1 Sugar phosphate permease [Epilithonimonas bovis DSM 19482]